MSVQILCLNRLTVLLNERTLSTWSRKDPHRQRWPEGTAIPKEPSHNKNSLPDFVMTTAIISVNTLPYSPERMHFINRADRIGRILFNAKRRGNALTVVQATQIVDAEIDQANIPAKAVAAVKHSAAATLARVQRVTKIARLMFAGLTADKAVQVVDAGKTEAVSVVSFGGTQESANDSAINTNVITKVVAKVRHVATQALRKLSGWLGLGAAL